MADRCAGIAHGHPAPMNEHILERSDSPQIKRARALRTVLGRESEDCGGGQGRTWYAMLAKIDSAWQGT
jgi:hypothetical protein